MKRSRLPDRAGRTSCGPSRVPCPRRAPVKSSSRHRGGRQPARHHAADGQVSAAARRLRHARPGDMRRDRVTGPGSGPLARRTARLRAGDRRRLRGVSRRRAGQPQALRCPAVTGARGRAETFFYGLDEPLRPRPAAEGRAGVDPRRHERDRHDRDSARARVRRHGARDGGIGRQVRRVPPPGRHARDQLPGGTTSWRRSATPPPAKAWT